MLSPEVTTQLTDMLHRMRDDLTAKVRSHGDAPDEATPPEIGPGAHMVLGDDAPEAEMISHDESSQLSRDDATLDQISRALGRLELGEADTCIVCGEPIPAERLLANPLADTCIRDQRDIEREANRLNPGAEPTM
jgi:DnaK suppressor protein